MAVTKPIKRKPTKRKRTKTKTPMTVEQVRNAQIFRLRGYYANGKTLPFTLTELDTILSCIDAALIRLDATSQSDHLGIS